MLGHALLRRPTALRRSCVRRGLSSSHDWSKAMEHQPTRRLWYWGAFIMVAGTVLKVACWQLVRSRAAARRRAPPLAAARRRSPPDPGSGLARR